MAILNFNAGALSLDTQGQLQAYGPRACCPCGQFAYLALECCDGDPVIWVVLDNTSFGVGDTIKVGDFCYSISDFRKPTSFLDFNGTPYLILPADTQGGPDCITAQQSAGCRVCPTDCCIFRNLPRCNDFQPERCCNLGNAYRITVRFTERTTQQRAGGAWVGGSITDPDTGTQVCPDICELVGNYELNTFFFTERTSIVYNGNNDCRPEGVFNSHTIRRIRRQEVFAVTDPNTLQTVYIDQFQLAQAIRTLDNCQTRLLNPRVEVIEDTDTIENDAGALDFAYPDFPYFVLVPDGNGGFRPERCNYFDEFIEREVQDPTFIVGNPIRLRSTYELTGEARCESGVQTLRRVIEQWECTRPEGPNQTFSQGTRWNHVDILERFEYFVEKISSFGCETTECSSGPPPNPAIDAGPLSGTPGGGLSLSPLYGQPRPRNRPNTTQGCRSCQDERGI